MPALFIGSHLAIDFLNTRYCPDGAPVEVLGDGAAYLQWLLGAGLVDAATARRLVRAFGSTALDEAAAEARNFREWARGWLRQWRKSPRRDFSTELAKLNALLARQAGNHQLTQQAGRFQLTEIKNLATPETLITLVATPIADLLAHESADLVKDCAAASCSLWFIDRSKSHRRRFCSPTACGNRAKVAAFRSRQRG